MRRLRFELGLSKTQADAAMFATRSCLGFTRRDWDGVWAAVGWLRQELREARLEKVFTLAYQLNRGGGGAKCRT